MKKTIEVEICDLCGREIETQNIIVPVYRTFDATDGKTRYDRKYFENVRMDLCRECLEKITFIHSIGVQCEKYKLRE